MAKKKSQGMPNTLQIGEKVFSLKVALIHSKVNGQPKLVTILEDDKTIDLAGGEEFVMLYVFDFPGKA
jgi:hypothetical protein